MQCFDQIACVHMSDLSSRSHMNAGQDGFREFQTLCRPLRSEPTRNRRVEQLDDARRRCGRD